MRCNKLFISHLLFILLPTIISPTYLETKNKTNALFASRMEQEQFAAMLPAVLKGD